ncbi:HAD family hydrolase, partial [Streptococcus suis]
MKSYKNYILDFYGTLVDIRTDENKLEVWNQLTQ